MQYYLTVLPGLEQIASEELRSRFGIESLPPIEGRNNILIPFETDLEVTKLLDIGIAEDLFIALGVYDYTGSRHELKTIPAALYDLKDLDLALRYHRETLPTTKRKTTFRVVAQAIHDPKEYRRVDLQEAVEKAILDRYHRRWELVEDDATLEIWVHLLKDTLVLGLRLSDERMRHRDYKLAHLPASLRPTVAYAMVWLSDPQPEDVFLDPMCGAGTILIERAQYGRYQQLYGGDIRPEALEVALTNIGNKYKPIDVREWDARDLPLENESVDKVVCNLPFGKQIGSPEENLELYGSALGEIVRVLKSGGRAVLLTSDIPLLKRRLGSYQELRIIREERHIKILGCLATILVLQKK